VMRAMVMLWVLAVLTQPTAMHQRRLLRFLSRSCLFLLEADLYAPPDR
jgi:hypothetical protein